MTDLQQPGARHFVRFDGFTPLPSAGAATALSFAPGDILPDRTLLIASGWAGRQRCLPDGRRQILQLALPGDVCGAFTAMGTTDPLVALTPLRAIPGTFPTTLPPSQYDRADPSRSLLAFEQWCVFNQLTRLGAMRTKERTAHLLLEVYHRLASVRLAEDFKFEMPLTQEQLADVLGLSVVHVNRTLQALRHESLIEYQSGRVRILKLADLAEIANFTLLEALERRP